MLSIFTLLTVGVAAASAQASNVLSFISTDNKNRTVYITPNAGVDGVDPVTVAPGATVNITLAQGFTGNAYAVSSDSINNPGMLAEVNFQGWMGYTFFDVSAIVDDMDHDGVHLMYPAEAKKPISGCETFPCDNAYYLPDDVQTKSTDETTIVVTLGNGSVNATGFE